MKKDFTRDLKDIQYFIDHVPFLEARVNVLEKMGYKIGVDVVKKENDKVGKIVVGKKGELRVQITPAPKGLPLARCVILD